jgi:hypothetical protein
MLKRTVIGASIAAASWFAYYRIRRAWDTWGVEPDEQLRTLPGDEVVPDGENLLTRAVTIAAPVADVWPWLVQMGFGRAGWYSYDAIDMKGDSALLVRPELQGLKAGDIVPTHPGGGFEVKLIETEQALVLYTDTSLVEKQAGVAHASETAISSRETPGLAAADRFLRTASPPDFAVSWAFVLEPIDDRHTRLIERTRGRFGSETATAKALLPALGFGVFVMMRKQLLGIRDRAEGAFARRGETVASRLGLSPAV